jgi:hypothetical protein
MENDGLALTAAITGNFPDCSDFDSICPASQPSSTSTKTVQRRDGKK